ncbi:MAG: peptidoglycan-binding protein [Clostridia bacterium]|nr:peptidoglycan-binding protein [Clostridia bacterium]
MKIARQIITVFLVLCTLFGCFSFNVGAVVKNGSKGAEVRQVQYNLNFLGFNVGAVDGDCGSKTVTGIKNYQSSRGLAVDGVAGPATQSKLKSEVTDIQNMLKEKGYYTDTVDGVAGPNTISALKRFQSDNGLSVTGVLNSATLNKLKEEAAASTLSIGSGKYTPGTLKEGNSYSISGLISSNYVLTSVTVGIYNANGGVMVEQIIKNINAKSYNINSVDNKIKFGALSGSESGTTYYFKVVASDASGTVKTLVNSSFKVVSDAIISTTVSEPDSKISIASGKYAPGSLTEGEDYSFSGIISSTRPLTEITIGIYNASGKKVQSKTISTNADRYDISKLNSYIRFDTLSGSSKGTKYYFRVTANDDRVCVLLVDKSFKVVTTEIEVSNIKISEGKYNPEELIVGTTYSISGNISSANILTQVIVGIYNSDSSETQYVKKVSPNTTSYNIKEVDNYIKFGKLNGNEDGIVYYFKVIAKDSSGTTVELVNNKFIVKKIKCNYMWPLPGNTYITSYYGGRIHPLTGKPNNHSGIDISAKKGTAIYAAEAGVVKVMCTSCTHNYGKKKDCGCGGGYGNYLYIQHDDGMRTYYAHMTEIIVSNGQRISKGTKIGTVGSTGSSDGAHLHFEMRSGSSSSTRVDPLDYVNIN